MTDFAGVASSGAQACSAIATYIGALKHRDEDLASISRHAQALESVFQALNQSLTEDSSDTLTSPAAALVSGSLQTCEAELNSLKQLMARFSNSLPPNARPHDKILQQATKLKYPLRKPDISRMQESLRVIEETLFLALQNLGLRYSQLAISKLDDVEEASAQASTSLDTLRSEVSALKDIMSNLQGQIPTVQQAIESIPPLISMKADLQLVQVQEFHRQSKQSSDALSESLSGLHVKLDGLMERFHHDFDTATAAVDESDARMPVYKLVSKPSNLASLCGSLDNLSERATPAINALQRAPAVYTSSCPCRQRSVHKTKRVSRWPLGAWDKEVITFKHYKGCRYFISNGDERSRLLGLELAGFLKNAITITFYTSTGAGGHSIGANIDFHATVDRRTSPAFRVMRVLKVCARMLPSPSAGHQAQWERLALVATQKLETLFRESKAGAKDVDSRNQSLLHAAAQLTLELWPGSSQGKAYCSPIAQVASFLIKRQVPASLRDLRGKQALEIALWSKHSSTPLAAAFYPEEASIDTEEYVSWTSSLGDGQWLARSLDLFASISRVAEAVLLNDQDQIHRLLRKHPEYLEERAYFMGWTPLHLALSNPDCLRILVKRCSPRHFVKMDKGRYTVLSYAIILSRTLCEQMEDEDESPCRCISSLEILLDAGCPIIPYRDFHSDDDPRMLADASDHCRVYLARSLLQRRQILKSLAQQYLSPPEIDSFNLHRPAVLDIYAMQVEQILRHRGFIELGPLATYVDDEGGYDRDGDPSPIHDLRSIYHELSTAKDAELYFGLGFHDISARLGKSRRWVPLYRSYSAGESLPFTKWLLDHDAPLCEWTVHRRFPSGKCLANGFILAPLLANYSHNLAVESDEEAMTVLEERILSDRLVADSDCRCTPEGCTPFVERLKQMCLWRCTTELEVAAEFTAYLKQYGNALQREHYHAAIRLITFEVLGIRHTCLKEWPDEGDLEAEEVAEIQDEYAELLELLESLVEEFEEHAFEAIEAATDRVDRMIAFWNGYWVDRMHQLRSELSRAGEESKLAAEMLGVSWAPEPDEASESSQWQGWDYYFRKIEEIE
ncbi:hypothetical protein V8C26DRAFT_272538 [Trichoderma gracile]